MVLSSRRGWEITMLSSPPASDLFVFYFVENKVLICKSSDWGAQIECEWLILELASNLRMLQQIIACCLSNLACIS